MFGLVVGGVASGVGKTTLTLGLIGALKRRGLAVQPFKVGPDYIDPSQHAQVAGRPSRNLDSWQVPEESLRELFARAAHGADAVLVEGVMGLFDGRTGAGEVGSTAHVARLLGLPILLVVDAAKAARSVAATVVGSRALDPRLNIIGVVLNNVASARHAEIGHEAIESLAHVPVLGWLPRNADLRQDERYLGLVPTAERRLSPALVDRTAALVEEHIDLHRLIALSAVDLPDASPSGLYPDEPISARVRIAVAQDDAFSFYYQDSLDLLQAWGAEFVPFSPLRDESLPGDLGGIYLGGGFPELFAIELSVNAPLLTALRAAASAGIPIYAECGGLMYLQDALIDADGRRHRMVGIVPGESTLVGRRLTLGYRVVRARRGSPVALAGQRLRGHEFHWSVSDAPPNEIAAYDVLGGAARSEGYAIDNVLASYLHLHFASDSTLAPRFVESCARAGRTSLSSTHPSGRTTPRPATSATDAPHSPTIIPTMGPPTPTASPPWGRGGEAQAPAGDTQAPSRAWLPSPSQGAVGIQGTHGLVDVDRPGPHGRVDVGTSGLERGRSGGAGHLAVPGPLLRQHGLSPFEIEALSRHRIEARVSDRLPTSEPARSLVARLVYAAGDPDLAKHVSLVDDPIAAAVEAFSHGSSLIVDVGMVAAGISRTLLSDLGVEIQVAIRTKGVEAIASRYAITRSAAGILALADALDGAVVAIGNAPTALLALLDLVGSGRARPAVVVGMPVGFVAAEESKQLLATSGVPCIEVRGTRGGSPLAAATVNYLLRLAADTS